MIYDDTNADGGLSDWVIAGTVVGSVVALAVGGTIIGRCLMSRGSSGALNAAAVSEMPVVKIGNLVQKRYPFGLKPKAEPFGLNNSAEP